MQQVDSTWMAAVIDGSQCHWHSFSGPNGDLQQPEPLVASLASWLTSLGKMPARVVIGLESTKAFFASTTLGREQLANQQSLSIAAESVLPLSAEEMVVDSVKALDDSMSDKLSSSLVACESGPLEGIVDALESSGLKVYLIIPQSLVWLDYVRSQGWLENECVLLVNHERAIGSVGAVVSSEQAAPNGPACCDLVLVENGRLSNWVVTNVHGLAAQLGMLERKELKILHLVISSEKPSDVARERLVWPKGWNASQTEVVPRERILAEMAQRYLSGQLQPLANLRRGVLAKSDPWRDHRSAIGRLVAAAALFLMVYAVCLGWQGWQAKQQALEFQRQQEHQFQQALPGTRVPAAVLRRLQTEHARVVGIQRQVGLAEESRSAVERLGRVLGQLPSDFPYRIDQISIASDRLQIDAIVQNAQQAGQLARSVEQAGYEAQPPNTVLQSSGQLEARLQAVDRFVPNKPNASGNRHTAATTNSQQGSQPPAMELP
jgi:hypothetical protein